MKYLFLVATLFLSAVSLRSQTTQGDDAFAVTAQVAQGTIEGMYDTRTGIQKYFGIPFAKPPVGKLRWRAPQPPEPYEGIHKATAFSPRAIQKIVFQDIRFRSSGVSEDCLYLNVWTPAKTGETGLPVLLYFHGGGNFAGSGDEYRYDGEALAQKGVIVVTANYRLGVFGFLAHPDLNAPGDPANGNYGLLDQAAALQWVHQNIEAFGGDANRITIGGESAGSFDCSALMASPLSRDKLAGVIGQSGAAIHPTSAPVSLGEAATYAERFLHTTGHTSFADLRRAPVREIYEVATAGGWDFPFVLDQHFLPATLTEIYQQGQQAQVPLMVGWTSAETGWATTPESPAAFEESVRKQYGKDAPTILRYYPSDQAKDSNIQLTADNWLVYATWRWADLHRQTGNAPVYRYLFEQIRPPMVGQTRAEEPIGAFHATDIEYFLNSLKKSDGYAWQEVDYRAADVISTYVVNFVKTGNPNGKQLPPWKPLGAGGATTPVMYLSANSQLKQADADDRYRFWQQYYSR